jgi:hypothetical protein
MTEQLTSLATALTVLAPLHLGALHPYEKALVALIAFGPFVVLFVVVYVVRKRDVAAEEAEQTEQEDRAG